MNTDTESTEEKNDTPATHAERHITRKAIIDAGEAASDLSNELTAALGYAAVKNPEGSYSYVGEQYLELLKVLRLLVDWAHTGAAYAGYSPMIYLRDNMPRVEVEL